MLCLLQQEWGHCEETEVQFLILIVFTNVGVPVGTNFPTLSFLIHGENCFDSHICCQQDRPTSQTLLTYACSLSNPNIILAFVSPITFNV